MAFPTDLQIAQACKIRHINEIAAKLGINPEVLEHFGKYKAKLPLDLIKDTPSAHGKLILVSAINPTPAGEGKTTTSIGLVDGLNRIGKKTTAVLREPSLGPVFGIKGGAAGGGYSQVVPMEDINLHFTGDFSAVEKANNLLSALIDNHLHNRQSTLNLDPAAIFWKRAMDMNDRALRKVQVSIGGRVTRTDGFNITAASEVMAILCMSRNLADLKRKCGNIFVGLSKEGRPVYARELKAEAAMTLLMRDAIKPNLVQTLEGNPAILHAGPFANIAQGTNTILATKMGLTLSDYVVTEAGFGADLGAEKFMNIKCGYGNLAPDVMVIVATIRALRHHGGAQVDAYDTVSLERVQRGFENLEKHIENCRKFGLHPVVAINRFPSDSEEETRHVIDQCAAIGIKAVVCSCFVSGGAGAEKLAEAVLEELNSGRNKFKRLYDWNLPVKEKIEIIAREIYGADGVDYSERAENNLKMIERLGLAALPICMAKTQKSLSDDEKRVGRPRGFRVTVREFEYAVGAGFLIPILGDIMRMPGLPSIPASEGMDIDENGIISGLS